MMYSSATERQELLARLAATTLLLPRDVFDTQDSAVEVIRSSDVLGGVVLLMQGNFKTKKIFIYIIKDGTQTQSYFYF